MDIVLYHFTKGSVGEVPSFTKLEKVNNDYADFKNWGIVYNYSYRQLKDNHFKLELTILTKADAFTPAIQQYLHYAQAPCNLNLELKTFMKEDLITSELIETGHMILKGCVIYHSSLFCMEIDFEDDPKGSLVGAVKSRPVKQFDDAQAISTETGVDAKSGMFGSMTDSVWQKTVFRGMDFETTMQTSDGNVALDTLRYVE